MTQFSYYHNYMMIWILVVCTFYIDIHFILLTIWCITLHLNKANCVCDNQSFRRFLYNICKRSGVVAIKFNFLFKFVLIINYESPNVPIQRRSISIIHLVRYMCRMLSLATWMWQLFKHASIFFWINTCKKAWFFTAV